MKFDPDLSSPRYSIWIVILSLLALCVLSFFLNAGILWLICWAFHGSWWSWRICFGIWLLEIILSDVFKSKRGKS